MSQVKVDDAKQAFLSLKELLESLKEDTTSDSDGSTTTPPIELTDYLGQSSFDKTMVEEMLEELLLNIDTMKSQSFDRKKMRLILLKKLSKQDIGFVILWIIVRGTNLNSCRHTSDTKTLNKVKKILKKASISTVLDRKTDDIETITLHRLMICFPEVAAMEIATAGKRLNLPSKGIDTDLPRYYQFRTAGSIVPKDLIDSWSDWYRQFAKCVRLQGNSNRYIKTTLRNRMDDKFIKDLHIMLVDKTDGKDLIQ